MFRKREFPARPSVGSRLTPHLLALGHHVRVIDLMLYTDAGLDALKADKSFPQWQSHFGLVRGDIRDLGRGAEDLPVLNPAILVIN